MIIPLTVISAYGFVVLKQLILSSKHLKNIRTIVILLIFIIYALNVARYFHIYYKHMAEEYPFSSQYGVKELVSYVESKENEFESVVITDRYDQPYILFLFYLKYPPQKFQQEHVLTDKDEFGFSTVRNFGKYYFYPIVFDKTRLEFTDSLIVGTDEEIPKATNIVKEVNGINGYKYFEVVAN